MTAGATQAPRGRRLTGTVVVLAVPLAALALLLLRPSMDLRWEHQPAHFWLVLSVAALSAILAYGTGAAAVRRGDARVLLVSLAFLAAAGFLGLHALATPGVLLAGPNAGFALATPVGLALGSVFAAASAVDLPESRRLQVMRHATQLRAAVLGLMALWLVVSVLALPPLSSPTAPERASGPLLVLAVIALVLYGGAAVRYVRLWRDRRSTMLLGMAAAFVLLAEAMVAVAFARNWHTSWWEWHLLMLVAFGLVARSAQNQWHEERFADLYLADTVAGTRDLSVLFADLKGFTAFSERHDPTDVTAMLNEYFGVAIPTVAQRFGGDIDRIIGDAVMVTFNRRGDQPDHARLATAAALALQAETARVAEAHPSWPRFRVGVNTGAASVSLLGAAGGRTHTVIGDVVNVASRLEGQAPAGRVVISAATAARVQDAETEPLGPVELKGKDEPVEALLLVSVPDPLVEARPPRRRRARTR